MDSTFLPTKEFIKKRQMKSKLLVSIFLSLFLTGFNQPSLLIAQDEDALRAAITQVSQSLTEGFNAGDAEKISQLFVEQGELIDEEGTLFSGREEIKQLLSAFFERFPGASMTLATEAIRKVGTLIIDDGYRMITDANGQTSVIRFTAVLVPTEQGWRIASIRDFPDEAPATPGDMLQSLNWLIGDWINEGVDGRVKVSYRWSEDKNFIIGKFTFARDGQMAATSEQRIGWDALQLKPRSWLFDSDGGFAEAIWTEIEGGWILNSSAVMPDGQTGSATLKIVPESDNRFILAGSNRVVGHLLEEDYELTIVRQPSINNPNAVQQ
jgi:uncharacterized protein (TIGR02246 family)